MSLFGQPCLLTGPLDEAVLRLIHEISPEQIPPILTPEQASKAIDKLRPAERLPAALETYRERLLKRLTAKQAFYDALTASRRSGKTEPILKAAEGHLQEKKRADFQAALKKLEASHGSPAQWSSAALDQLAIAFDLGVEPHPEEEFHRAIQKVQVRYDCSFEEGDLE